MALTLESLPTSVLIEFLPLKCRLQAEACHFILGKVPDARSSPRTRLGNTTTIDLVSDLTLADTPAYWSPYQLGATDRV